MSSPQNTRLGIWLMIATSAVFALQDGLSRHLGAATNVYMVVTVRFWFMAVFVTLVSMRSPGGLGAAVRSAHPAIQALRGLLLIVEICLMVVAFVKLGLIETHAVFVCYPLLVSMLSGPILGEKVGWRRWAAVGAGFVGVLIILQPGSGVFSVWALFPFASALMFAVYGLLTRYVARDDAPSTSFFWAGIVGAIAITPFGLMHWQPMAAGDWAMMAVLCCTAVLGHWLLIKAYDLAEASAIQPFAYFQLPFVSLLGFLLFSESLRMNVLIGAAIVVGAGLFTLWRQRLREKQGRPGL
ncbi:DMT family transporter [Xinfangfangia pollutisoli]|uniref:DMT family transporter n=1 Tax=Xinfangfangia pollutisoli TaxID=2865960 RepID=UPI001CD261E5|nr:DMT family transporter [Xinfangfangia pollutisoli]